MPINTPKQVSFVLTAVGSCNSTTIQSVRDSLIALMSDPVTMYGVYTPNLVVDVGCLETGAFQVGVVEATTIQLLHVEGNTVCSAVRMNGQMYLLCCLS